MAVSGDVLPRDAAVIGVKVSGQAAKRIRYFLSYDAKLDGGYTNQTASAGVKIRF